MKKALKFLLVLSVFAAFNNGTPCQDTKLNFYHEPFFANYV